MNPINILAKVGGASLLVTILVIVLVLMLVGALPQAGFAQDYRISGGLGLVLIILVVLILLGRI